MAWWSVGGAQGQLYLSYLYFTTEALSGTLLCPIKFSPALSNAGCRHLCAGITTTRTSWPRCTGSGTHTSSTSRGWRLRRNPPLRTQRPTNTSLTCSCPATTTPQSWTSWVHMQASRRRQVSSLSQDPYMSQLNPVHILISYSFEIQFNIILPSTPWSPK